MLDKFEIAAALRDIALLLRFHGENRFRARAYEAAADAVEVVREDLAAVIRERRLTAIPGIGAALAATIAELHQTGGSQFRDRLRQSVPRGVAELTEIAGLGPKKILTLRRKLGIETLEDLRKACEARLVRAVEGFGEKTERRILESIHRHGVHEPGHLLFDAIEVGARLLESLQGAPGVVDAAIAGSVRRWKEVVGDVDLVASAADAGAVIEHFRGHPGVAQVVAEDASRCRVRLAGSLHVDLVVAAPGSYASVLHRETGSAAHNAKLEQIARERGLALRENGAGEASRLGFDSEASLYRLLGMPYVPPELREDAGEIEAALAGTLPQDLVDPGDIRGFVHCHTVYSDGKNTIEEMARAAEALGMSYLTITDHSPAAGYAGGLDVERLKRQWDEISRVQELVHVRLFRGTESDILEDGALDYPDGILDQLDIVIASIHSRMKMDAEQMTRRLVRAMRRPQFKIWGHALGRLLRKRPPFECRVEEVLDAIAESRAAIEINGDPYRLDLEPRWVRAARQRGIRFVISTDAHSIRGLDNVRFGVAMARRGWVTRAEVLNTFPADDFRAAVRPAA